MAFKFYLDGQLTDQPVNDKELSTSITRNNETFGLVITQDVELIYNGNNDPEIGTISGYTYLKNLFDNGSCYEATIQIFDETEGTNTVFLYEGVVKVPSIEIDLQMVNLKTKVQDNSFYAYINNNKRIKYNLSSLFTKNRLPITPVTQTRVKMFNTLDGTYDPGVGYNGVSVYDAFTYLVGALSDNKVGFYSAYLKTEPILYLFTGEALVDDTAESEIEVSFEQLYNEVKKAKNIGFFIDITNRQNPVLRLEDVNTLYGSSNVYHFDDIKEMNTRVKIDNIYGTIRVGVNNEIGGPDPVYSFPSGISYLGYNEEVYVPLGQCNIDNELELINDFKVTTNQISYQIFGAATTDLTEIFMIECEYDDIALQYQARQYESWVNTVDYYYNKGFSNPDKMLVQNSNYQSNTINTLTIGTLGFRAELGQGQYIGSSDPGSPFFVPYTIQPIVFTDETTGINYDGSGNYDNTTGIYICSVDGLYSFNAEVRMDGYNFHSCANGFFLQIFSSPIYAAGTYQTSVEQSFNVTLKLKVYTDSTLSTLITETVQKTNIRNGTWFISNNIVTNLSVGNAVICDIETSASLYCGGVLTNSLGANVGVLPVPTLVDLIQVPGWSFTQFFSGCSFPNPKPDATMSDTSYFECNGSPDGSGLTFGFSDPQLFKNKEYEFQYYISQGDFEAIKNNPTGLITFEKDNITRFGWIDVMKRNDWTGLTNIKLVSQNASITQ